MFHSEKQIQECFPFYFMRQCSHYIGLVCNITSMQKEKKREKKKGKKSFFHKKGKITYNWAVSVALYYFLRIQPYTWNKMVMLFFKL